MKILKHIRNFFGATHVVIIPPEDICLTPAPSPAVDPVTDRPKTNYLGLAYPQFDSPEVEAMTGRIMFRGLQLQRMPCHNKQRKPARLRAFSRLVNLWGQRVAAKRKIS